MGSVKAFNKECSYLNANWKRGTGDERFEHGARTFITIRLRARLRLLVLSSSISHRARRELMSARSLIAAVVLLSSFQSRASSIKSVRERSAEFFGQDIYVKGKGLTVPRAEQRREPPSEVRTGDEFEA